MLFRVETGPSETVYAANRVCLTQATPWHQSHKPQPYQVCPFDTRAELF